MADIGAVPRVFGSRSEWFDTPWVGILGSTLVALAVSFLNFSDIISSVNYLYSMGMLLEFASFLRLRVKFPEAYRPYKVPLPFAGVVIMCLVPSGFLIYVMVVATWRVLVVSALMTIVAVFWYFLMKVCRSRMWIVFADSDEKDDLILH